MREAEAFEASIFSPASPIRGWRPTVSPEQSKEGKVIAPLYTVLLCVPAVLALMMAVYGLVVLCPRQRGARPPTRANGKTD
jgi:hypothetical protein